MSAAANPQVELLFIKSAEDEAVLAFDVSDAVFEFHVQQAIEKLLKALIAAHGKPYPFTHDLDQLIERLEDLGELFPDFGMPLQSFTPFGVLVRYDHGAPLTSQEREQFRRVVASVRTFVQHQVPLLP